MEKSYFSTKKLCFVALFMAINVALSSFGVPVLGGHVYLNDIIICMAGVIFDPLSAFIVGGIGAFIGDFLFYQKAMFVSLVVRSIQSIAISLIARGYKEEELPKLKISIIAVIVGAVIMIVGYSLGRAYFYGTPQETILKLPFQISQAVVGGVVSLILLYKTGIKKLIYKIPKK